MAKKRPFKKGKEVIISKNTGEKTPKIKFFDKEYKRVLTRVVEGTGSKNNPVFMVEFKIPELETDWMWLLTTSSKSKAKTIANMCKEGRLS